MKHCRSCLIYYMKVMNGLVMTLEEDEIFMYLAALLCKQFCRFANEGAKISIKSYFMRSFLVQSALLGWLGG